MRGLFESEMKVGRIEGYYIGNREKSFILLKEKALNYNAIIQEEPSRKGRETENVRIVHYSDTCLRKRN